MDQLVELAFWQTVISAGLRLATPLIFASLGETLAQRAGVLNLGLEGFMIAGALGGLYVAVESTWWVGVLAGGVSGVILSAVMVVLAVRGRASQIVIGFGLTILGIGATGFVYAVTTAPGDLSRRVDRLGAIDLPVISDLPLVGPALFTNSALTWAAIAAVPVVWWVATRTTWGLAIRACGEDPDAAAARGVDVVAVRSWATLASGLGGGLGGAAIAVGSVGVFQPEITAGRGFIALAVILMAAWSPLGAFLGSLVFGLSEALSLQLRTIVDDAVPTEAVEVLPYVVTLVILVIGASRSRMPRALGVTFVPDGATTA